MTFRDRSVVIAYENWTVKLGLPFMVEVRLISGGGSAWLNASIQWPFDTKTKVSHSCFQEHSAQNN
jgi:hypothetical protein